MNGNDSMLPVEHRNSKYLKGELMSHLFYRLNYSVVADEFRFMDVFGVRRNGYMVEFEIKVTKEDFNRELRCVNAKVEAVKKYGKDWEKFIKHRMYLTGEYPKTDYDLRLESLGVSTNQSNVTVPNEFVFYVPDFLGEYAVSKLQALPYGVVTIGKTANSYGREYFWRYNVLKKPVKLHTNKATPALYEALAHALTIRNRLFHEE